MKIKRFEKAESFRFFNRTLQVFFFATACLMAFFLSWKSLPSLDITSDGRYSLTPETVAYLRTLSQEVEVIGSLSLGEESSLGGERLHELQNMTMRYAAVTPKLQVKWVDGFRAQSEFGFKTPYRILVRSADRQVWITPEELYLVQDDVFLGERALTSALWRLGNPTQHKVVVVAPADRWSAEGAWGFRRLEDFFASRNTTVTQIEPADLLNEIPACDAVFILGSANTLNTASLANLQRIINDHKASVLVAIDEMAGDALVRFLYFNGVNWPAQRIGETDPKLKTPTGEMLVRNFEDHPITRSLKQNELAVLSSGHWWALEGRKALIDITLWPLLKSSPQSIVEGTKTKGTFNLMMAMEKKTVDGNSTRVLISGSSDWLSNAYLSYRGNQTLLESSYDWLLGGSNLLSIPPRTRQARQLGLNSVQLWRMGGWILSCSVVILGVGVIRWFTRPR